MPEFGYPSNKSQFCKAIENLSIEVTHKCVYDNWRKVMSQKLIPSPSLWAGIENLGDADARQRKVGMRLIELLRG